MGRANGEERTTERLLRAYVEAGDHSARQRLIELYLPLVRSLARRYRLAGVEQDDLVQAGSIGLINAIDRFDPERGGGLVAYAVPTIQGEIKRHLRDRAPALRLPRDVQELEARLTRTRAAVEARTGRTASTAELARELEVEETEVERALAGSRAAHPAPLAADEREEPGNGVLEPSDERLLLADAFHSLDDQERRVLYLRFVRDLERAEAARQLGVSQRTLSRQTERALSKLRDELESQPAGGALEHPAGGEERDAPAQRRKAAPAGAAEPAPASASEPAALAGAPEPALKRRAAPVEDPLSGRGTPLKIESMAAGATELPGKHHDPGYHISIAREEGSETWTARVEELAGCVAEGATPDEAAERVRAAMDDWIAEAVAAKRKLPEPRGSSSHSGRLLLRMPQSLHAELARAAEREEVSLNQFITGSLASAVGWGRVGEEPRRDEPGERGRLLPLAIAANTVVVIVATVIALVLLIVALREGL